MGRYQRGYIIEASNAFHVRYRAEEIVDGKLVRKQRSHRLCTKEKGLTAASKSVRRLCVEFMAGINAQVPGQPQPTDITITAFWDQTYLPFVQENHKPSTTHDYKQVWLQRVKDHFGNRTLHGYKITMTISLTLCKQSLQHFPSSVMVVNLVYQVVC